MADHQDSTQGEPTIALASSTTQVTDKAFSPSLKCRKCGKITDVLVMATYQVYDPIGYLFYAEIITKKGWICFDCVKGDCA